MATADVAFAPIIIGLRIKFREEVITRRTVFDLNKARDRAHILVGLAVAVANIDEVIRIIRNAKDPALAKEQLLARSWVAGDVIPLIALVDDLDYFVDDKGEYKMSEPQVKAILDLRLHRLTGLEREKIGGELREITEAIKELLSILASREKLYDVMKNELIEMKVKFGTPRRTEIVDSGFETDIEDLIQREDMVVTITHGGYVKRTPLVTYRAQKRGGKGRSAVNMKDEDFVSDLFVASTHTPILFFTSKGIVHRMKVYQLPLGRTASQRQSIHQYAATETKMKISRSSCASPKMKTCGMNWIFYLPPMADLSDGINCLTSATFALTG
jgi:DNA gyrase subunit A